MNPRELLVGCLAHGTSCAGRLPETGPLEVPQNRLETLRALGMAGGNAMLEHAPIGEKTDVHRASP